MCVDVMFVFCEDIEMVVCEYILEYLEIIVDVFDKYMVNWEEL